MNNSGEAGVTEGNKLPDYYKMKPNYLENDAVLLNLTSDDSNDVKNRRKRKLGKPTKLNVDSTKTDVCFIPNTDTLRLTEGTNILGKETHSMNESIPKENSVSKEKCSSDNGTTNKSIEQVLSNLLSNNTSVTNVIPVIEENHHSPKTNEESQSTRKRRSSEYPVDNSKKNFKKRRKSCSDLLESEHESMQKPAESNNADAGVFNEVESQLEKMFAGIIETDENAEKTIVANVKAESSISEEKEQDSKPPKEKTKKQKGTSDESGNRKESTNASDEKPKKLRKNKKGLLAKNKTKFAKKQLTQNKNNKNVKNDDLHSSQSNNLNNSISAKYKGPIIQLKSSNKNPTHVQIVNAPREEDEEKNKEKRKPVSNGIPSRSKRSIPQNNLDYRGKLSNVGMFNSTLSLRYDAHKADATWVCIFCKRGPHFIVLGAAPKFTITSPSSNIIPQPLMIPVDVLSDLYGPYFIKKKSVSDSIVSLHEQIMSEVEFDNRNEQDADKEQCEIWMHEQCLIWTPGVFITGGRIRGLQSAVLDASSSVCTMCGLSGANISCIHRGCQSISHYCCALTNGWKLDVEQYIPKCNIHKHL